MKSSLTILLLLITTFASPDPIAQIDTLNTLVVTKDVELPVREEKKVFTKGLTNFLALMSKIESTDNPHSVNRYGYIGKYQFAPSTLEDLGITSDTSKYLNDIELQDSSMLVYMKYNWKVFNQLTDVDKYIGTSIDSVNITKSGMLAGAHLVGVGGVLEFLHRTNKYKMTDGNGVHVSTYMKQFEKFDVTKL